jgi:hypothetical protein
MTKKDVKVVAGPSLATSTRVLRTIKMLRPIHAECQWPRTPRWWEKCEQAGHDPYFSTDKVEIREPIYDTDEDGDLVQTGEKVKTKLVKHPNITQVPLASHVGDGKAVEVCEREKGFRFMEDMGFAPLCQMYNCWAEAKINTAWGLYCSPMHARLVAADEDGIALEVYDRAKRRKQLRAIDIG